MNKLAIVFIFTLLLAIVSLITRDPKDPNTLIDHGIERFGDLAAYKSLLPILETDVKYEKAFYYELDNVALEKALTSTFNSSTLTDAAKETSSDAGWQTIDNDQVAVTYNYVLKDMKKTFKTNRDAFRLPDGTDPPFQIVHDALLNVAIKYDLSKDSKELSDIPWYLLKYEVIIFRESKYQGKHLGIVSVVDPEGGITYLQMKVIGVVSADDIGIWPVKALDTTFLPYSDPY